MCSGSFFRIFSSSYNSLKGIKDSSSIEEFYEIDHKRDYLDDLWIHLDQTNERIFKNYDEKIENSFNKQNSFDGKTNEKMSVFRNLFADFNDKRAQQTRMGRYIEKLVKKNKNHYDTNESLKRNSFYWILIDGEVGIAKILQIRKVFNANKGYYDFYECISTSDITAEVLLLVYCFVNTTDLKESNFHPTYWNLDVVHEEVDVSKRPNNILALKNNARCPRKLRNLPKCEF